MEPAGWHRQPAQALALQLLRSLVAPHQRTGSPSIARKSWRRFWSQPPPLVQRNGLWVPVRLFGVLLFAPAANAAPHACESAATSALTRSAPSGPLRRYTSSADPSVDQRDSTSGCLSGPCLSDRSDIRPPHR